jgi:hypothetical protein
MYIFQINSLAPLLEVRSLTNLRIDHCIGFVGSYVIRTWCRFWACLNALVSHSSKIPSSII